MFLLHRERGERLREFRAVWVEGDDVVERAGVVGAEGPLTRTAVAAGQPPEVMMNAVLERARGDGFEGKSIDELSHLAVRWGFDGEWLQADDDDLEAIVERLHQALWVRGLGGADGSMVGDSVVVIDLSAVDANRAREVLTEALKATAVAEFATIGEV